MADIETLQTKIQKRFGSEIDKTILANNELTIEVSKDNLLSVAKALRDEPDFDFKMLIDVCGVDYLHYGVSEWQSESATGTGFERGVLTDPAEIQNENTPFAKAAYSGARFASVCHLLSITQNHRIRLRTFVTENDLILPSLTELWPAANWFERESFDLFGIMYEGHPDLRRILTDYGFVGHPFRKDFPLIGKVEARYDAKQRRVVYEKVSIEPRILEPKVIRTDPRYKVGE